MLYFENYGIENFNVPFSKIHCYHILLRFPSNKFINTNSFNFNNYFMTVIYNQDTVGDVRSRRVVGGGTRTQERQQVQV